MPATLLDAMMNVSDVVAVVGFGITVAVCDTVFTLLIVAPVGRAPAVSVIVAPTRVADVKSEGEVRVQLGPDPIVPAPEFVDVAGAPTA
jgi:hypothetical protein